MSHAIQWLDAFERLMTAVTFAEKNDQKTAKWILKSKTPSNVMMFSQKAKSKPVNRPVERMSLNP